MSLVLFLEIIAKSLLVAGATLLILRLVAGRSAAERSWVGHVGLLGSLVVPFAGELLPRWSVAPKLPTIAALPAGPAASAAPIAAAGRPEVSSALDPATFALMLYAIPAVILLAMTAVAVVRLFALRNRATVLVDHPWLSALAHAQRRMRFKSGAALLVSNEISSPISWGLVRPTILVNESTVAASGEAEAIIAHELAHVARLDWAKLLAARVATALFWFNPLVWLLARQCHQLREEAADDAVLRSDVDRTDYAALLVGAARHESRGLLLAANGVAASGGSLHQRVTRVLDTSLGRAPAQFAWSLACVAAGMAVGIPLASVTLRATPSQGADAVVLSPARGASPVGSSAAASAAGPVAEAALVRPPYLREPVSLPPPVVAPATSPSPPAAPLARSSSDWMALTASGVSGADLDELAAISPAYARFGSGGLVALRAQGVGNSWLREMQALGYRDLPLGTILQMAAQDVTPGFVREMAAVGYRRLTTNQLIAMRIQGVTPRLALQATAKRHQRPTADELIAIAIFGMDEPERPPGSTSDDE